VLLLLQVRDSDPGLHGSRLLVAAAAPANHSRSLAPGRTLRQEAKILQAGAYMHEMQGKNSKGTRKSQIRSKRVKQDQRNKADKDSERGPSVRSQTVGVRWKYSGRTRGSDLGGRMLTGQRVGVRRLGLGPGGPGTGVRYY
jgi:hypothetical protein